MARASELDPRTLHKMRRALGEMCESLIREAAHWTRVCSGQSEYASGLLSAAHDIESLEHRIEDMERRARARLRGSKS